ncbi:glycosyltransferase family 4 protein [Magnetospirillum fulvum]|jgi:glycosyltransferase involved in cell wall biosynthesis|uniref:Glycosyltransferase n=1 Tax=Magnetospirillum fulvum MGU-K5 TaxID=1316936 RepID=S9S810_MAGFU|nr:glycosyltransferase family 1 protein [Magnetospirillum fulvum]EPY02022.1 glycosyltransferase [Magnetospirillum fulvum MGU-K5]
MRILVVSDAWLPQVNGVVRTLDTLRSELERTGHEVVMLTPERFRTIPCPTYPEIRLAVRPGPRIARLIEAAQPCAIHIATEGPLGWAARRYCLRRRLPFTTAYHTRFPEYIKARFRVPLPLSYAVMRRFHAASSRVMVATQGIETELEQRGFHRIGRWSRGVDTDLFRPRPEARGDDGPFAGLPRPIFLYVGRVAVEKNIAAFLALDLPGSKVVVGDGPQLDDLRRRHPEIHFAGAQFGEALARHYAAGDVFVFPSRTDTFGLVLLEALASGLPVAAYPVPGPLDVIGASPVGRLDTDLGKAALGAIGIDPALCRAHALDFSWAASTRQFVENLAPFEITCWKEPAPV